MKLQISLLYLSLSVCLAQVPCDKHMRINITDHQRHENDSISAHGRLFHNGSHGSENGVLYGCPCDVTSCLRMCQKNKTTTPFNLTVTSEEGDTKVVNSHDHFFTFDNTKMCAEGHTGFVIGEEENLFLYANGSLFSEDYDVLYTADVFCVRLEINGNLSYISCEYVPPPSHIHLYYAAMMLISVFFLGLTLLGYTVAPEMRNLHGSCVAAHAISLMLGFFFLAIIMLVNPHNDKACIALAFLTYLFLMSSFVWLSIMCFDIWWTFSGMRAMATSLRSTPIKKFSRYCALAWGIPLLLFTLVLVFHLTNIIPEDNKPGIGKQTCWFNGSGPTLYYFHGPLSLLLFLNLCFFLGTTVRLINIRRETAILKKGDSRTHMTGDSAANRQKYTVYVKLFLVMGLTWPMEVISSLAENPEKGEWWWKFFDAINMLQGVFIFLVCVWFTRTRDTMLSKLCTKNTARRLSSRTGRMTMGATSAVTKLSDNSSTCAEQGAQGDSLQLKTFNKVEEHQL